MSNLVGSTGVNAYGNFGRGAASVMKTAASTMLFHWYETDGDTAKPHAVYRGPKFIDAGKEIAVEVELALEEIAAATVLQEEA